jgi:hypothetical protein
MFQLKHETTHVFHPPSRVTNNVRGRPPRPCLPECRGPPSRKSRRTATAPRYQTKGADDVLQGETMNATGTKRNLASWVACAQAYGTDGQQLAVLFAFGAAWQQLTMLISSSEPLSDRMQALAATSSVVLELANMAGARRDVVAYLENLTTQYAHAAQSENELESHEAESAWFERVLENGTEAEQREAAQRIEEFETRCDELARRRGREARTLLRLLNASQVRVQRRRVLEAAPPRERPRGRARRPSQRVSRFRPSRRVQVDAGGATADDGPSTGDADPPGPRIGRERRRRAGARPSLDGARSSHVVRSRRRPGGAKGAP